MKTIDISGMGGSYEAGATFSQDWQETGLLNRRPYSVDKGALTNVCCLQRKRDSGGRLVNNPSP